MADVRGVIFDMGGIIHPSPFEVLPDIERERGLPQGTFPRGPFDPNGDPDYGAMDRGEITEGEYVARLRSRLAARSLDVNVYELISWDGRDRPEVVEAIRALARRYRLGLLTNDATTWLGPGWWRDWYLRDEFIAIVDAAEEGVRKPDPDIYLRVARALDLPPEACLFVDDLTANVDGALAVGMRAFKFDVTDARGSVERLLAALLPGERVGGGDAR